MNRTYRTINYTLTFNQSLRWTDERKGSTFAASHAPLYAHVKRFVRSTDYLLTISNPSLNFVGFDQKCYSECNMSSVGFGTLNNDIFGLMRLYNYDDLFAQDYIDIPRILVGYSTQSNSIILCTPDVLLNNNVSLVSSYSHWCNILFIDCKTQPLALVIPLSKMSVK